MLFDFEITTVIIFEEDCKKASKFWVLLKNSKSSSEYMPLKRIVKMEFFRAHAREGKQSR